MSLQRQSPPPLPSSGQARVLREPVPEFLSSLFGYNRAQVRQWVLNNLEALARVRAHVLDLEEEVRTLREQLSARSAVPQQEFRLPPSSPHVGGRRPRHLRTEPAAS